MTAQEMTPSLVALCYKSAGIGTFNTEFGKMLTDMKLEVYDILKKNGGDDNFELEKDYVFSIDFLDDLASANKWKPLPSDGFGQIFFEDDQSMFLYAFRSQKETVVRNVKYMDIIYSKLIIKLTPFSDLPGGYAVRIMSAQKQA